MAGDNVFRLAAMQDAAKDRGRAAPPPPRDGTRPVIRIELGARSPAADDAEQALIAANAGIYCQGGRLVRPVVDQTKEAGGGDGRTVRLVDIEAAALLGDFEKAAIFEKYSAQADDYVTCSCPDYVAAEYLARGGNWRLPYLMGVACTPIVRRDGSIVTTLGYDESTGLIYEPLGVDFGEIPGEVTLEDARAALAVLKHPIKDFSFANEQSLSVALAGMLTAVVRRALPTAPMFIFTATVAGSGKTKLAEILSIMAQGTRPAIITRGHDPRGGDAEFEKRLTGSLLAGDPVILIDNIEGGVGGEMLNAMTTGPKMRLRPLGTSKSIEIPISALVTGTGNNVTILGDMTRRALPSMLDPGVERPELRTFSFDPVDYVMAHRVQQVVAALTVVRGYIQAGCPMGGHAPGSFGEWSRLVREPLMWAGEADPWLSTNDARDTDPRLGKLTQVSAAWEALFGVAPVTVRQICDSCQELETSEMVDQNGVRRNIEIRGRFRNRELRDAVNEAIGGEDPRPINANKLAWWLRHNGGRVVAGRKFVMIKEENEPVARWQLVGAAPLAKGAAGPHLAESLPLAVDDDIPF